MNWHGEKGKFRDFFWVIHQMTVLFLSFDCTERKRWSHAFGLLHAMQESRRLKCPAFRRAFINGQRNVRLSYNFRVGGHV
jgi:hypothetical protein